MRARIRLLASPIADLDVTAFINLMVVLVSFFLSSVTYFQFSSLELNIPPARTGAANEKAPLELEVFFCFVALEVNNRIDGLIRRNDKQSGDYDYKALGEVLKGLKADYPLLFVVVVFFVVVFLFVVFVLFLVVVCFFFFAGG